MRLAILTLALLTGASAMARDTNFKLSPDVAREDTQLEQFLKTERGQDMQRLIELMQARDEEGFQKAHEAYRKKYNAPPLGGWPDEARGPSRPAAPEAGPPMMLPPEAR